MEGNVKSLDNASEWYNHLDYTGDEHLSRWDVVQALVNIAIYPSQEELVEIEALIGDGSRETFLANFGSLSLPRPKWASAKTLADLRVASEGKLYSGDYEHTFSHNAFYISLAYFAFPLNIFLGKKWALKVMSLAYYEDFWVKYLYIDFVMHFLGLSLATIALISGTEFTRTVTALFYFSFATCMSAQICFEALSNMPAHQVDRQIKRNVHQASYYIPLILDGGKKTNVRDFLEEVHKDDALFLHSVAHINFKPLKSSQSLIGRNHSRPSIVHTENSVEAVATRVELERAKSKDVYPRANQAVKLASSLIAACPFISLIYNPLKYDEEVMGLELASASIFLIIYFGITKALPPLQHYAPRHASKIHGHTTRYLNILRHKTNGEAKESNFSLVAYKENLDAIMTIRLIDRTYTNAAQADITHLASLGLIITLVCAIVSSFNIVLNPSTDEIVGNPVTLLCLVNVVHNVFYLIVFINHAIKANEAFSTGQAKIMSDILHSTQHVLAFEDPKPDTRKRLTTAVTILSMLIDESLKFPVQIKVLKITVTKELRVKLFGLLVSLALSSIVRIVQENVL